MRIATRSDRHQVIYIDSSVVLAQLLAEDRVPSPLLWSRVLVSSRLLVHETWNRINARGLRSTHSDALQRILAGIALAEMSGRVLGRALEPMPVPMRTLDALHLATADFIRSQGISLEIATFDRRMSEAASALGFCLTSL